MIKSSRLTVTNLDVHSPKSSHVCPPHPSRLFLLAHLDAAGDHVELGKVPLEEAPGNALEELNSFTPPSWCILVSDCSSESDVPSRAQGFQGQRSD